MSRLAFVGGGATGGGFRLARGTVLASSSAVLFGGGAGGRLVGGAAFFADFSARSLASSSVGGGAPAGRWGAGEQVVSEASWCARTACAWTWYGMSVQCLPTSSRVLRLVLHLHRPPR